jgi:hypothetical protein
MYLHSSTVFDDRTVLIRLLSSWRRRENTIVALPNMFQSFLKQDPTVNPHYEAVKAESEDWIAAQVILLSAKKLTSLIHRYTQVLFLGRKNENENQQMRLFVLLCYCGSRSCSRKISHLV